jgi:3-oxoacid CoA-transferase subunit B
MARKVARLLRPGEYVNLGTGLPTLVSDHLEPEQAITLHSENGMLGFGPLAVGDAAPDIHRYNASGQLVAGLPGESFTDSAEAFAMAGAARDDDPCSLASRSASATTNWRVPARRAGGSAAMDPRRARRIVVMIVPMTATASRSSCPRAHSLTAERCVAPCHRSVIDAAATARGRELPRRTIDEVRAVTAAPLAVAPDVREMDL